MHVNREDDVEVYYCEMDAFENCSWDVEPEQEICFTDFNCSHILVGEIFSKGYCEEYLLELNNTEEFNPEKITILYDDIDEAYQIVTGVMYGDKMLESTGETTTTGKSERWYIMDLETREQTKTQ
jgi:hypothetical protein